MSTNPFQEKDEFMEKGKKMTHTMLVFFGARRHSRKSIHPCQLADQKTDLPYIGRYTNVPIAAYNFSLFLYVVHNFTGLAKSSLKIYQPPLAITDASCCS